MNRNVKNYPPHILQWFALVWLSFLVFLGFFVAFFVATDDFLREPVIKWVFLCLFFVLLLIQIIGFTHYTLKVSKVFAFLKELDQTFNYKKFLFLFWIPIVSFVALFISHRKTVMILNDNNLEINDYDWTSIQKGQNKHKKDLKDINNVGEEVGLNKK